MRMTIEGTQRPGVQEPTDGSSSKNSNERVTRKNPPVFGD